MKLLPLVLRNVGRNRRRTALTVLSLAVPFLLLMTLQTALDAMDAWMARADRNLRVVVFHKMGLIFDLPESYAAKLARIPGVTAVCPFTWYGGLHKGPKEMFSSLSVNAATFRTVWPEGRIPKADYDAFLRSRTAAIVDSNLSKKFGWKKGDPITLKGTVRPVDMKFEIVGIIEESVDPNGFFFHREYLEEALGQPGITSDFWMMVDRAENIPKVQKAAVEMFANSPYEVKAEVEKGFINMFLSMSGDIRGLVQGIGMMVVGLIMLVAANSIAMSVRERTGEVAVMKAIGFPPASILAMILAESALVGLAAGIVGCTGGYLLLTNPKLTAALGPWGALLQNAGPAAARWTWIAPLTGMAAGFVPAFLAARLKVVDALRKVA
jgi:putative ABC transport system permease protein